MGFVASVALVQQFAFVIVIQGLFLAVLGLKIGRLLLFPLAYMAFAVPFGRFMIPPLQDLTAFFVVKWLRLIDVPVFLDGIFISIPTGNFEVAELAGGVDIGCSGCGSGYRNLLGYRRSDGAHLVHFSDL